jgi:predicted component of type VI protein secretion system
MTSLVIESGKHRGKRFSLPEKECVIGRQEGCAIRLTSRDVSKMHCAIQATAEGLVVRDLGSRNGTLVNDVPVTGPTLVRPGETIRVGPMTFRVVDSTPKPAPTPEHPPDAPAQPAAAARKPHPAKPHPLAHLAQPPADPLSEDDIAALLTDGVDGLSGDTTVVEGAAGQDGADSRSGPRVDDEVVRRAAAVIRNWHLEHANGG